ncbi:MAG: monofunctional biosynthetic peptidoglycan transglycosylase [Acidobacteria bacterium]|nr:monofunctional biosynthetic peptidoglycan transglycosylase [Acidobacteriota bacterium]MCA1650764.1 monofunctional biosynthetic peptidoglycan transglycosylase [Acidobacteriota bacterium]
MRSVGRVALALFAAGFACGAYIYLTLPDVRPLKTANPTTTAFMDLRARQARAKGEQPKQVQRWISYGRISSHLKRAVLVAEDSAFWQHDGVDFEQLKESMEVNLERREFVRGASTITQQLAKNLYLSPSKNPVRKLRELLITRRLEGELTKQRILEIYLNVIEWGDGVYGAEAAARTYFGRPAADLGPQESALLAGAIINPRVLDPGHPTARLRRRQQMIMRRMGAVTPPPVVAEAATDPSGSPPALEPVPTLPGSALPAEGPPTELPGQVVPPPPKPLAPKPPGQPPGEW